jgi:hypothetical protein
MYGAMTFYLAHAQAIDTSLAQAKAAFAIQASTLNAAARMANFALFQRLEHGRQPARPPTNDRPLPGGRRYEPSPVRTSRSHIGIRLAWHCLKAVPCVPEWQFLSC